MIFYMIQVIGMVYLEVKGKCGTFFMEAMVLGHVHSTTSEMESMIQSMVGTHKFKYEKSSEEIKNMPIFLKQISLRRIK
jgi:hypothetical protein